MLTRTTPDLAIAGNGEAATALHRDSCHASSGRSASSSPGVGSARLGADLSGSQSSGGTARTPGGGRDSRLVRQLPPPFPSPSCAAVALRRAAAATYCAQGHGGKLLCQQSTRASRARVAANGHVGSDVAVHVNRGPKNTFSKFMNLNRTCQLV